MTELKPCPFCGKQVWYHYDSFDNVFKFKHLTAKDRDNCIVCEMWIKAKSLSDAREKWNRRADDDDG